MAPTVDNLRNDIRTAVDRYERVESTAFTKEALAAVCEALGVEIASGRLPPKSEMRAAIAEAIDDLDAPTDELERPFRKAELETIRAAVSAD